MRFVRRVRWLRVSLVGLAALVGLLSFRLWQWMDYAERQAARVEFEVLENDRLERELKDARTLVHGIPDEIVRFEYMGGARLRPAHERLEMILSQEYVPDELRTLTQEEVRLLWKRLAEHRASPR